MKGTVRPRKVVVEMTEDEAETLKAYLTSTASPEWDNSPLGDACEELAGALTEGLEAH